LKDYKQAKRPMGVYGIRNATGELIVK
jgi:hypothetical protein